MMCIIYHYIILGGGPALLSAETASQCKNVLPDNADIFVSPCGAEGEGPAGRRRAYTSRTPVLLTTARPTGRPAGRAGRNPTSLRLVPAARA